jgi:uncharacterized protein YndB with AHSA1/START domain
MNPASASDTIVEEIEINAPAERIFVALTNPRELVKWWRSEGRYWVTEMQSDLRPGGRWMTRGSQAGGKDFSVTGVYREIDRPRLLVYTWHADWEPDAPEGLVRFDLKETDGVTTVRVTHSGLVTQQSRDHYKGWSQVLAWLQAFAEK